LGAFAHESWLGTHANIKKVTNLSLVNKEEGTTRLEEDGVHPNEW
jgi:hypothetical protein